MHTNKHSESHGKFWYGFAMGSVVCGIVAAAFGTKQGRTHISKAVRFMDDIEAQPDQIDRVVDRVFEMYGILSGKSNDTSTTETEKPTKDTKKQQTRTLEETSSQSINQVIAKMKSITTDTAKEKKNSAKSKKQPIS